MCTSSCLRPKEKCKNSVCYWLIFHFSVVALSNAYSDNSKCWTNKVSTMETINHKIFISLEKNTCLSFFWSLQDDFCLTVSVSIKETACTKQIKYPFMFEDIEPSFAISCTTVSAVTSLELLWYYLDRSRQQLRRSIVAVYSRKSWIVISNHGPDFSLHFQ